MPKPSKSKRSRGRPKITQKPCVNPECNDGKDQPKENFSDTQWIRGGSKCKVCVANNLGPPSGRAKKRKAARNASNELARTELQKAKKVKEQLAEAEKTGDEARIAALEEELELANASAKVARDNSYNGYHNDRRNKSNALARAAQQNAEEAKDRLAKAMVSGADKARIAALEKELELANASAEVARDNSYNGYHNDRRNKSNALARAAQQNAEEAKDRLAKAEKTGDEATISALEKEVELANASAKVARDNSHNGKQNDRRNKRQFPSGFVLDTRTLFVGLDTLRPNRKPSPRRDVSEIGQIILNGFKSGQSAEDVVAALHELKMK
jgi:hypothetical protein